MTTSPPPSPAGLDSAALPWVTISPGFAFKLLRATTDDAEWVELLRLDPGTVVPRHRHTGDVHVYNLAGTRELLDTGELVGPGGYVYEPAGNVDSWRAVGDEPLIVFATVHGAIEYIDDRGEVTRRSTPTTAIAAYRAGAAAAPEFVRGAR